MEELGVTLYYLTLPSVVMNAPEACASVCAAFIYLYGVFSQVSLFPHCRYFLLIELPRRSGNIHQIYFLKCLYRNTKLLHLSSVVSPLSSQRLTFSV